MTNVKMPEPVACLWIKGGVVVNAFNRPPCLHDGDPRNEYFIKKGFTEEPLITTDQAEAYAATKVREALDAAAKVAMNAPITADMLDSDSAKAVAFHTSARIRALIPKETT